MKALGSLLLVLAISTMVLTAQEPSQVQIGSKKFTEAVILGEVVTHLVRSSGVDAVHRRELGGTRILFNALVSGEIDVYVEYTGTLIEEILAGTDFRTTPQIRARLATQGIGMSEPLGFNNTYAVGMRKQVAEARGISRISDLVRHPDLNFGFSNEFMDRRDGWPGLRARYGLPQSSVRGMDHDLAYRGLEGGTIDAIDIYSTDAEIAYYDLRVLEDDLQYFPRYLAILLYRLDLEAESPAALDALRRLEGAVSEPVVIAMNSRVKLEKEDEGRVAADFLAEHMSVQADVQVESALERLARHTGDHLFLVLLSLSAAILIAVPLGIAAARGPRFGPAILAIAGIIQTIPSLALLVFMIPLLGIGSPPAIVALFLYSLLPIIRNTYAGLHDIPAPLLESARALGLPSRAVLRLVELPLAARSILAGIKTSAVINVGTATLGALIGAGGYGQPILTGIRLDDVGLILQGAVPAAVLALLVQATFDWAERRLVPKGLQLHVRN